MKKMPVGLWVVWGLILATGAVAQDSRWNNTGGGIYHDPANWSNGVPVNTGRAYFSVPGTYTVTFTNDATSSLMFAGTSTHLKDVTFNLGGFTYTRHAGDAPTGWNFDLSGNWLTISNGTFVVERVPNQAYGGEYGVITARVTVASGGRWVQNAAGINIGMRYVGEFVIADGGRMDNVGGGSLSIGRAEAYDVNGNAAFRGTGVVIVEGSGVWSNYASDIRISAMKQATGTVNIVNGGQFHHMGPAVNVGYGGDGFMNVLSGGLFAATNAQTGAHFIVGRLGTTNNTLGVLVVSNENSRILFGAPGRNNQFLIGSSALATGAVFIADQGQLVHAGTNFFVGSSGLGTLHISGGGVLDATGMDTNSIFYIGNAGGSEGRALITGANSKLIIGSDNLNHQLRLANATGSLGMAAVENGGAIEYRGHHMYVGNVGTGILNVNAGGLFDATQMATGGVFYIGTSAGSFGTTTVAGVGAELRISEGGRSNRIQLANSAGSIGTLNISAGGKVTHKGSQISIGTGGTGFLNITDGGVLDAWNMFAGQNVFVAVNSASTGTVIISGAGSHYRSGMDSGFYLGNTATGTRSQARMLIEDGGVFTGSSNSAGVVVGYRSDGELVVQTGGMISNTVGSGVLYVGYDGGTATQAGYGSMLVSGTTSRVILGDLFVARRFSTGDLVIASGGTVEAFRSISIGPATTNALEIYNAKGTLTVTGEGSVLKRTALTTVELPLANITSPQSNLGIGAGAFNGWTSEGIVLPSGYMRGQGALIVEKGGLVDINGLLGVFSNSSIRIAGGRTTSAQIGMDTGSVFNVVLQLSNANSTGLMTATGEVRLWGAELAVELADGYSPNVDDVFTLIDGAFFGVTSRFSRGGTLLEDESVFMVDSTQFRIDYFGGDVLLTVIPEPGTLGLIGVGLGFAAILRRRRKA
ncbi:MAG: PEP-CTERM sorting domain-containing protein [Kiritimatiellia bacterium]|nr:PEP-CTERM sorting domain-containing protein [Kiritimatiellia bacterium]